MLSIHPAFWHDRSLFKGDPTSMARFRFYAKSPAFVATIVMVVVGATFAGETQAQAIAEVAGTTSVAASATAAAKPVVVPKLAGAAATSSQHLIASGAPPAQETNVRDLQAKAGKDAGKVLLRATPAASQIWVNGKIVGQTPLLLVLAPGKYQVEMRGARGETGTSTIDLLPRETRDVQLKLQSLYPARVKYQQ
jgi:hypothetical protein